MSLYVAAYDICDDDRRERVARVLARQGDRVQRSVFELWLEPEELGQLRVDLIAILMPEDVFDLFPVDQRGPRTRLRWQHSPDSGGPVIIV